MTLLDRRTDRAPRPTSAARDAGPRRAATLTCDAVGFRYPGAEGLALREVSLASDPGSITALVGPSGCGKTTLLKLVGGLLRPTSGRVLVDGRDATAVPVARRRVGWVPQQYALFEHLDVTGNVAFGLRAQKVPAPQRVARVAEMLALCRIEELAGRSVAELSGGQRQRVAIARALAPYPSVLLLDEPLAALDPQLRVRLRAELATLIRAAGVTTLLVTHDQDEAFALADLLVLLRAGEVVQAGTSVELWDRPADAWTAEFLGRAVVVPAAPAGPRHVRVAPGVVVPVGSPTDPGATGLRVALRDGDLRAEPVQGSSGPEGGSAALATVRAVEFAGEHHRVRLELDGGPVVPAHALRPVQVGERVTVASARAGGVPVVGA